MLLNRLINYIAFVKKVPRIFTSRLNTII